MKVCEKVSTFITNHIFSYQFVSVCKPFLTGHELWKTKVCHRLYKMVRVCNTSQKSPGFVFSKTDPDNHNLETQFDASFGTWLQRDTIGRDNSDLKLIMLIVEKIF